MAIPELMAPAGDWQCVRAAVENGADAVYFGARGGFNARAKAVNFDLGELPRLMAFLRARGVKGYLTLNTLVFDDELEEAERTARAAVAAGVDAVLVQDLGLLRLLGRLCPEWPVHASTQMTLSSAETIAELSSLGVRRVVLPRELSIAQIAAIRRQTDVEIEVFVHGALCISYSGQCLASLTLGGRSANRGRCAQPCRLPYELLVRPRSSLEPKTPTGFWLSPHDLAAFDRLPELVAAGVAAFKIEGRLKTADYVASVTRHYRAALDAALANPPPRGPSVLAPEDVAEMETTFSRGFCHGWLDGPDPHRLVSGQSSAKRGALVGVVQNVRGDRVLVKLSASVRRGDGVVFQGNRGRESEQGGRVFEIFVGSSSVVEAAAGDVVAMAFRRGAVDPSEIEVGQTIGKTDDPRAARRLRKTYAEGPPRRRVALDVAVEAAVGAPLRIEATAATGFVGRVESPEPLPEAVKHPLTREVLAEQLGRLGGTPYELRGLEANLDGRAMIPLSVLGKLRHEMVAHLDAAAARPPTRPIRDDSAVAALRAEDSRLVPRDAGKETISVLCRSMAQIEAALERGASSLIADFQEVDRLGDAVRAAHAGRASILLATPRIHKPGESEVFERLARQEPDGILARNLAALGFCRRAGVPAVADFSLNAANRFTVAWLRDQGASRVTASYDLDVRHWLALADAVPPEWLEVVVYRRTPLFHSDYCLFCGRLSRGRSRDDCGRPCRRHTVRLRDRRGVEHLLAADSQCRNTLYHAEPQSLLDAMPALRNCGIRHFRVELLNESKEEIARIGVIGKRTPV